MNEHIKTNPTKKIFIGIAVLLFIFFVALLSAQFSVSRESALSQTANTNLTYATTTISAPNGTIVAQISDTEDKQTQGLSDRTSLPVGTGMLFVFGTPAPQYMWMKDMNFPLDMVWIDQNKRVVHVETNVSPATYLANPPEIFYSPTDASYVLELRAFDVARLGISVGSTLKF